jgi:hypothetical protein
MTATQRDIAYAIGVLRQYNHDPNNDHMVACKPVFQYLNGTNESQLSWGGAPRGALRGELRGEGQGALGC